ncbi:MAG: ArnT family glycosyltransferase [Nitrospiria bacterium]
MGKAENTLKKYGDKQYTDGKCSSLEMCAVLSITLIAFVLRVWNIGYDLPRVYRGIEYLEVMRALELGMGQFNFNRIAKGGLFYLLFFEYGIFFVMLRLMDVVTSAQDFAIYFLKDLTPFWMIGRMTSVIMGTVSVVLVYLLGKKVFDFRAGILAALFFALNPIHIEFSHYICVDIPMVMMSIASFYMMAFVYSTGLKKYYLATGLCIALAMLNKFPAIVLFVPFVVVHYARLRVEGVGLSQGLNRRIVLGFLIAGTIYVVGAPGILLKPGKLLAMLGLGSSSKKLVNVYSGQTPNLWFHYSAQLFMNLGLPLFSLVIIGLTRSISMGSWNEKYLSIFCLVFFVALSISHFREWSAHYLMPIFPPGLLIASKAMLGVNKIGIRKKWFGEIALLIIVIAASIPLANASVNQSRQFSQPNTRELAKIWIEKNIRPGSKFFMYGFPGLSYSRTVQLDDMPENLQRLADEADAEGKKVKARFFRIQASEQKGKAYDLVTAHTRRIMLEPPETYRKQGIQYVVLDKEYFDDEEDTQYTKELNESRMQFHRQLLGDPQVKLVAHFDPNELKSRGPHIEIFKLDID